MPQIFYVFLPAVILFLTSFLVSSCASDETVDENSATVCLRLRVADDPVTRSLSSTNENTVKDLTVLIFDSSSQLIGNKYVDGLSSPTEATVTVTTHTATGCTVYAIANTGSASFFSGVNTIAELDRRYTTLSGVTALGNATGVIMEGSTPNVIISTGTNNINVAMKHLCSKVNVSIVPSSGITVNFYAYYPTGISGSIIHAAGSAPVLSYTVPDNAADQIDILTSSKADVAGDSYNQASVDFKHIFAAVQFSVGSNGVGSGTISSISIGNVHNSGTYDFGSGWTLGTSMKAFTISQPKTISGTSGEDIYSGTYTLMMIPQTINNSTVTITYSNGGTLTKTISGTWEAGQTYNYGLSFIREYNYTGNVQSFIAPVTGTYKLEVWGAQGGGFGYHINAPGGYAGGFKKLEKGDILYVVVGGKGYDEDHYSDGTSYNGGGTGHLSQNVVYGGGGATHIATRSGCLKDLSEYKSTVLIVGGGGGSNGQWEEEEDSCKYESGGGEVGLGSNTIYCYWIDESKNLVGTETTNGNTGGTQTCVGSDGIKGGFGYGGSINDYIGAGAGGGGWYGGNASGGGGVACQTNGGGGSGYIGGVDNGSFHTGARSGNGYARISFVSAN